MIFWLFGASTVNDQFERRASRILDGIAQQPSTLLGLFRIGTLRATILARTFTYHQSLLWMDRPTGLLESLRSNDDGWKSRRVDDTMIW